LRERQPELNKTNKRANDRLTGDADGEHMRLDVHETEVAALFSVMTGNAQNIRLTPFQ
jgi:hypothetical protein